MALATWCDSGACGFDGSIADGLALPDGSGSQVPKYSSEINVGGSLTYGFNWRLNKCTGLGHQDRDLAPDVLAG